MRLVVVGLLVLTAAGCANNRLYDWGGYDSYLYAYYDNPSQLQYFRDALQQHIEYMEQQGKKPAPGLYAELGTLYLEQGDRLSALHYYEKERLAWPESKHLMSALITNINKLPEQGTDNEK